VKFAQKRKIGVILGRGGASTRLTASEMSSGSYKGAIERDFKIADVIAAASLDRRLSWKVYMKSIKERAGLIGRNGNTGEHYE